MNHLYFNLKIIGIYFHYIIIKLNIQCLFFLAAGITAAKKQKDKSGSLEKDNIEKAVEENSDIL